MDNLEIETHVILQTRPVNTERSPLLEINCSNQPVNLSADLFCTVPVFMAAEASVYSHVFIFIGEKVPRDSEM